MNILITNDDGVFAPGILAAKQAVEDLGNVTVVAPAENNSSVGRRMTLFKHLELKECELEDRSPAYSVSGSPADSVIIGADYVCEKKPDLVIAGINAGVNISCDITSSGTVCAALEAVSMGIPAIAASLFIDPKSAYRQDENGQWHTAYDFEIAKKILRKIVIKIKNEGFPDGVDMFNLNVPTNYESEEIALTTLSHRMLEKTVIDRNTKEKKDIFTYGLDEKRDDNLVMITSNLADEYDTGSDGYVLLAEKRPSLTPLDVNMTYRNLENWKI